MRARVRVVYLQRNFFLSLFVRADSRNFPLGFPVSNFCLRARARFTCRTFEFCFRAARVQFKNQKNFLLVVVVKDLEINISKLMSCHSSRVCAARVQQSVSEVTFQRASFQFAFKVHQQEKVTQRRQLFSA